MSCVAEPSAVRAFDRVADSYDEIFTNTPVGRAQREQVWRVADRVLQPGMHVLELNCGTGEDAIHFAERGIRVTGTDASSQMITRAKFRASALNVPVEFRRMPIEALTALRPQQFDAVFSNFSGLNCVRDLQQVARALSFLLRRGSRALLCLSTRHCFWEFAWFALRGQLRRSTRRWQGRVTSSVSEVEVDVYYPTVGEIKSKFRPWFRVLHVTGIGIAVPPTYVPRFPGERMAITALSKLDTIVCDLPVLRTSGDHMLLQLERTDS